MTPVQLAEAVVAWGGLKTPATDAALSRVCAATVAHVAGLPVLDGVTGDWPAPVQLGATMLAARLYRRRNSPNGLETFGEDGMSYVSRYDPDVARLLRVNAPMVG